MTPPLEPGAKARIAPAGLIFLAVTSVSWGLNWPIMKQLLTEWPPLSARGLAGLAGGGLLALLAVGRGQSLRVPSQQWPRLLLSAFLNVTVWMILMGLALVRLPASEATVLAYTMPIWTTLMAWPILGERMTLKRVLALLMAFAGIIALMGGDGFAASAAKLPGVIMILAGAVAFGLGTVVAKGLPRSLPILSSSALQICIGSVPVALAGLLFEHADFGALTGTGWAMLAYMSLIAFCIAYFCWFAALERLPASVAAIGTMVVPVIGVITSAVALHEPLGIGQIAALLFTLAGVVLATRS
jgi:drug/metabolite transporter (DMT)-like permease